MVPQPKRIDKSIRARCTNRSITKQLRLLLVVTFVGVVGCRSVDEAADTERTTRVGQAEASNQDRTNEPENVVANEAAATPKEPTAAPEPDTGTIGLSTHLFEVDPESSSADLRLQVWSTLRDEPMIDRVDPSCGCILTTVQRRKVTKEKGAEIYVAVLTPEMSDDRPYTVDVYTTADPDSPLRLTIWKRKPGSTPSTAAEKAE